MKYFNYIITHKLKAEEVRLSIWNETSVRSKILNSMEIDKNLYTDVLCLEGYEFLINEHRKNIIEKKFDNMDINLLISYVEKKYLPAVYEVFNYLIE